MGEGAATGARADDDHVVVGQCLGHDVYSGVRSRQLQRTKQATVSL